MVLSGIFQMLSSIGFRALCPSFIAARVGSVRGISFNFEDALDFRSQLTEEERTLMDQSREYAQAKLLPRVTEVCLCFLWNVYRSHFLQNIRL